MMSWWGNLEVRDRQVLMLGGVLLGLILLYVVVWQPLERGVRDLERGVDSREQTLRWMRQAAAEVAGLKSAGKPAREGLKGRSLLAVVDQSARQAGLGGSLKRVEPEDKDKVRVWLEAVPFDGLVTWTGSMADRYGVTVSSIRIERKESPGRVDARVTLAEPAG